MKLKTSYFTVFRSYAWSFTCLSHSITGKHFCQFSAIDGFSQAWYQLSEPQLNVSVWTCPVLAKVAVWICPSVTTIISLYWIGFSLLGTVCLTVKTQINFSGVASPSVPSFLMSVFRRRGLGKFQLQSLWDFWWNKRHRDSFVSKYCGFPASESVSQCSTAAITDVLLCN
jgi:hypothetical protein